MATAQQVIELVFKGIDQTGAATQSALGNLGSFANSAQTITQPVADFTGAALKLEAGILAAGVAMVAFSVKTAGDFDASFRQISTLFKASGSEMDGFKEDILSYSSTSSKSLKDITDAISAAVGSGVEWSKSLELIGTAERLAVATRADLKSTTEVLVSTMNAYGMKTEDAGKLSDLFFQIIADGKIEMQDLSQYLANLTPISAAAGISMKEVGGAIATLTAGGMQPSTAIDALKSAISNIIKPSEQAAKEASSLGIEFNASALKSKGLATVLDEVAKATGGSTEKMALLFGDVTGLAAVLSLTGAQAGAFKDSIANMGNSAGAVAEAFGKMKGSIEVSTAAVTNALTALFVRIGAPLLDEFGGIAAAIAAVFNAMGASVKDGNLGGLVAYVEGLMGQLQATIATVAKNMPAALEGADFSGFKGGIDAVVNAFKTLFGNIDLSTVNGLTRAIELAGAAFLGLSKFTGGVIESFKPLFDKLVEVGSGLGTVDSSIFKTMGEMAGFATQANMLAGGLNSILPALDALVGLLIVKQGIGLAGALGVTATAAGGLAVALGTAGLVATAGAAGYAIGTQLGEPINSLVSKLTGSQTTLGGWIYDLTHSGDAATAMGTKTGDATAGVDKLAKAVGTASTAAKDTTNPFEAANAAMLKAGQGAKSSSDEWGKSTRFLELTDAAAKNAAASALKLADATGTTKTSASGIIPIFDAATGKIIGYEQGLTRSGIASTNLAVANGKAGDSAKKTADDIKKAEDATKKWNEEVAKMKFEEKLKLIEQQTKLMTAQIEADAKKAVAAFESINTSITSTGDVLGTLFGTFKDFGSMDWSAIRMIEDQIDTENALRKDAFELQKRLVSAQIAQMKAQTDALIAGDGLIKIDGAGLKPHLEAFMWEILQAIQVKVNKDGLKMLLGA